MILFAFYEWCIFSYLWCISKNILHMVPKILTSGAGQNGKHFRIWFRFCDIWCTILQMVPFYIWCRNTRYIDTDDYCVKKINHLSERANILVLASYQLTYQHSVCWTIWNDVWSGKKREITWRHNAERHLGHSEDWIFCVSLTPRNAIF